MANFDQAVVKTIAREGGARYTETPGDTGGGTKYGISKRAYPQLDIANLSEDRAKEIYRSDYWDPAHGDDITSQLVAENIFDTAVNMGVGRAVKLAQMALGIQPVTGNMDAQTLQSLNNTYPDRFTADFTLAKVARYVSLCNNNRSQSKFLLGWLNRALGAMS